MDNADRGPSVFQSDRIACLLAQYRDVARGGSRTRLDQVAQVLRDAGFSEEQIVGLYVEATMHVDDIPGDFVPDLDAAVQLKESMDPHPLECTCPACKPRTPGKPVVSPPTDESTAPAR